MKTILTLLILRKASLVTLDNTLSSSLEDKR